MLGILLALVALPLLALGAALAWVNTEGGRATVARLAAAQVPGLAIEGLTGPIPGRLGAARITLADKDGIWLTVEEARIALDLMALTTGTFRIERLEAARIALPRLPAASDTPAPPAPPSETVLPQLPSLPVAVALDHLGIGRLELGAPILQQDAAFSVEGNAALAAGALRAALDLKRLDAEGGASLALSLAPAEDRLSAKLALREAPGGIGPTPGGAEGPAADAGPDAGRTGQRRRARASTPGSDRTSRSPRKALFGQDLMARSAPRCRARRGPPPSCRRRRRRWRCRRPSPSTPISVPTSAWRCAT